MSDEQKKKAKEIEDRVDHILSKEHERLKAEYLGIAPNEFYNDMFNGAPSERSGPIVTNSAFLKRGKSMLDKREILQSKLVFRLDNTKFGTLRFYRVLSEMLENALPGIGEVVDYEPEQETVSLFKKFISIVKAKNK